MIDPANPPAWIFIVIIFAVVLAFAAFLRINAAIRAWGRRRDEPLLVLLIEGLLQLIGRVTAWASEGALFRAAELEGDRPSPVRRGSPVRARRLRSAGGNGAGNSRGNTVQLRNAVVTPAVTASERQVTPVTSVTEVTVSVTEAALIATLLARGMSPSAVVKKVPGYSPKKNYDECKTKVDMVLKELDSEVVLRRLAGIEAPEPAEVV